MMGTVITQIYYSIAQGKATMEDWHSFAVYADRRLHRSYPEADISVILLGDDPEDALVVETRTEGNEEAGRAHLLKCEEVQTLIDRVRDDFSRQPPVRY